MSMNNKQRWLGGVVVLSGGVLLAALLLKGQGEIKENAVQKPPVATVQPQKAATPEEMVQLQPLTVDVATEKRLLEEQRRAREKAVAEQEARAAEFLAMQQRAEAEAARKAAEEYAALNARRSQQSSDNIPPELIEDAKTDKAKAQRLAEEKKKQEQQKQQLTQQQRDAEKKRLADDKRKTEDAKNKADAERKAAEEKKRKENERTALERKENERKENERKVNERKALEEKKQAEERKQKDAEQRKAVEERKKAAEERKQKDAERKAAEEKKRKADEAKKKAEADKARQLLEKGDKQWMVQVALAANEDNAEAMASKLRAKGYKVTKSKTSKGVRIMVGPAKDRDAAYASRKRITGDESLGMKSAWIIEWVPLDKR